VVVQWVEEEQEVRELCEIWRFYCRLFWFLGFRYSFILFGWLVRHHVIGAVSVDGPSWTSLDMQHVPGASTTPAISRPSLPDISWNSPPRYIWIPIHDFLRTIYYTNERASWALYLLWRQRPSSCLRMDIFWYHITWIADCGLRWKEKKGWGLRRIKDYIQKNLMFGENSECFAC